MMMTISRFALVFGAASAINVSSVKELANNFVEKTPTTDQDKIAGGNIASAMRKFKRLDLKQVVKKQANGASEEPKMLSAVQKAILAKEPNKKADQIKSECNRGSGKTVADLTGQNASSSVDTGVDHANVRSNFEETVDESKKVLNKHASLANIGSLKARMGAFE